MIIKQDINQKNITIEEMYEGQVKALLDVSEMMDMFNKCIKKLSENYIELTKRVEKLEKKANKI